MRGSIQPVITARLTCVVPTCNPAMQRADTQLACAPWLMLHCEAVCGQVPYRARSKLAFTFKFLHCVGSCDSAILRPGEVTAAASGRHCCAVCNRCIAELLQQHRRLSCPSPAHHHCTAVSRKCVDNRVQICHVFCLACSCADTWLVACCTWYCGTLRARMPAHASRCGGLPADSCRPV
jgi:hypothetical protein